MSPTFFTVTLFSVARVRELVSAITVTSCTTVTPCPVAYVTPDTINDGRGRTSAVIAVAVPAQVALGIGVRGGLEHRHPVLVDDPQLQLRLGP